MPVSETHPLLTTAIMSALRIVDRRCAITSVVRSCMDMISSSAACTSCSLSLSSADVASSSSSTAGALIIARAIAMRCFCPPDSCAPFSPTTVSYPSLSFSRMNVAAFACAAAASTSARVAPGLPCAMFSATVPWNSTGSCDTSPSCERSQRTFNAGSSTPSKSTRPDCGS